jgi:glycosyltransferase EpsD
VLITINQEDYERAQRFRAKKVVFVPGVGIDMGLFCGCSDGNVQLRKELSIPNDATVLLSVGELIKRKNHRVVIEALPALENVWYVICGQGPLQDEDMELADKLGVGDRVVLAGYRTDVKDFYDMADIFVLPSYQEGLSVALMEAMASGLPCVVSDIRGNADLIKNDKFRFSPDDKNRLISILKEQTVDKQAMSIEGIKNRKTVEKYRAEIVIENLKSIYCD